MTDWEIFYVLILAIWVVVAIVIIYYPENE